jgi:acyl-CoA dehydrogenase
MAAFLLLAVMVATVAVLACRTRPTVAWIGAPAGVLALFTLWPAARGTTLLSAWLVLAAAVFLLAPSPWRRRHVAAALLGRMKKAMPAMTGAERAALDAGSTWWEAHLLGGKPDWAALLALPASRLTAEEDAFLDGPVNALCEMLDEWRITRELHDLPAAAWDHIRRHRMLGMSIPKAYGGLGFSALAQSEVVARLASRSATAAVSVMVPNALGPAELLRDYGTPEQKDYYLPRLARGAEIPCFALTAPDAGSDASGMRDFGIVCRAAWQGRPDVLGIRITWEKRYITLGPIATLLALAFRLYDPDLLIGPRREVGITLALIPAATPGVHIGRRHVAMDAAFMTGPNWGRDVFVPMSCVIGGVERAGEGWAMVMNCLAAGRALSLPATSCGVAKLCALTTGAYSRVRRQFGLPIGRFEGVETALARVAGNAYVMDAARLTTAAALDAGEKPAVVSAIVKYHLTERVREVVNDAMDIHAGKAICMGPSNYLAHAYQQVPVAITVEGANILTRSMMIFGQGVVRAHPYLAREMAALRQENEQQALRELDAVVFAHTAFFAANALRTLGLGITDARGVRVPGDALTRRHYAQLGRFSAALAFVTDVVLLVVGGELKRRERLSARLADILSLLYLGSCVLKHYEDAGSRREDAPLLQWAMVDILHRMERAFCALCDNLRPAWIGRALGACVFPRGRGHFRRPDDELDRNVARCLLEPGPARERLTAGVFVSRSTGDAVATLEAALQAVIASEPAEARIRKWRNGAGVVPAGDELGLLREAVAAGVVSASEAGAVERAHRLRRAAVMVDDFPPDLRASAAGRSTREVTFEQLRREEA